MSQALDLDFCCFAQLRMLQACLRNRDPDRTRHLLHQSVGSLQLPSMLAVEIEIGAELLV